MAKKEEPRRRSLNDLIEAAVSEDIDVAGIGTEPQPQSPADEQQTPTPVGPKQKQTTEPQAIVTKKATTIMPKEVFNALQMYCTQTDTPKHRALYLFILDGLHAAGQISDSDYQRFRDMAALLTTTYEKK